MAEFKCVLPVLFAVVNHSNDNAVNKTDKVIVVVLSGVEPLGNVDGVSAMLELAFIRIFVSLGVAGGFVSGDDALSYVVLGGVPLDLTGLDGPKVL